MAPQFQQVHFQLKMLDLSSIQFFLQIPPILFDPNSIDPDKILQSQTRSDFCKIMETKAPLSRLVSVTPFLYEKLKFKHL